MCFFFLFFFFGGFIFEYVLTSIILTYDPGRLEFWDSGGILPKTILQGFFRGENGFLGVFPQNLGVGVFGHKLSIRNLGAKQSQPGVAAADGFMAL